MMVRLGALPAGRGSVKSQRSWSVNHGDFAPSATKSSMHPDTFGRPAAARYKRGRDSKHCEDGWSICSVVVRRIE